MLKVIISLKIITALTNFVISLLTCFQGYYKFNFSTLKKLTEITFHLLVCQIKSHFFLIPFLIFSNQATARADHPRGDSLYIIPQTVLLCQLFFHAFFKFFSKFLNFFFQLFLRFARGQLDYIITLYFFCQLFFYTFFNFFRFFCNFFINPKK